MRKIEKLLPLMLVLIILGCKDKNLAENESTLLVELDDKKIDADLPVIGLLIYDQFLTTEITAPLDVFGKHDKDNNKMFNVISIAKEMKPYVSEEGLKMIPDYTFENCPDLDVIIVPSSYDIEGALKNKDLIEFIKEQDKHTTFTASNCAGAYLIGASGVANGKKIVTYIGGGSLLQETYPEMQVQNDSIYSFMKDGKLFSSNGNLSTYLASLEMLEEMTSKAHREYVESQIYIDRIRRSGQQYSSTNTLGSKKGMIKVTILYPNSEGKTFDMDYYSNTHMPMIASLLGDSIKQLEIDKGTAGRAPNEPIPYLAIGYLYFDSLSDFQTSFGPHAEKIRGDVKNYTNIQPIVQISEVLQ